VGAYLSASAAACTFACVHVAGGAEADMRQVAAGHVGTAPVCLAHACTCWCMYGAVQVDVELGNALEGRARVQRELEEERAAHAEALRTAAVDEEAWEAAQREVEAQQAACAQVGGAGHCLSICALCAEGVGEGEEMCVCV